jgi:hypothetical protein
MTVITALFISVLCGVAPAGERGGKIAWSTDLAAALESASADSRPVMIYFTADW